MLLKNCNLVYIVETGLFWNIQFQEHRRAFKSVDLLTKSFNRVIEIDHIPEFDKTEVIKSNCMKYNNRFFEKDVYQNPKIYI